MGFVEVEIVFALLAVLWIPALFRIIAVRRTRYVLRGGWLIVRQGVFTSVKPYELTHLTDVELTRSLLDHLTGNGRLHLTFHNHGTIILRGFAPIAELETIMTGLNDLARLLRSNPLLKGLVT